MEKMPPFEPAKRPEQAHQETELERELIEALKKGESNPEAQKLMREWSEMREREVAQSENFAVRVEREIELNRDRARLQWKAGYREDAFDNFEDALYQARHKSREDRAQAIEREMRELFGDDGGVS